MKIQCVQCGKTAEGEGLAFCPYCGAKLPEGQEAPQVAGEAPEEDPRALAWRTKALEVPSIPERKKILTKGLAEFPDSRALRWEMLFIGEPAGKPPRGQFDFSIIKSWLLQIYRDPNAFPEDTRNAMRKKLFDDPKLEETAGLFPDPEGKKREYLLRLCLEYIEVFLEEDSRLMGSFLGFRINRNKEKALAGTVAEMIGRMKRDQELLPGQREQLAGTFYRAYFQRMNGKTEYLDEAMSGDLER